MNDLKFAFRQLLKHLGFTAVAVISITIGIGSNTAIFTVANALLFRHPAGVLEPERLVDLGRSRSGRGFNPNSYPIDARFLWSAGCMALLVREGSRCSSGEHCNAMRLPPNWSAFT